MMLKNKQVQFLCLFLALISLTGIKLYENYFPTLFTDWNNKNLSRINLSDPYNFSFAIFGDNQFSILNFEEILNLIELDPEISFVISLGDMVHSGNRRSYSFFLNLVQRRLHKPLITVIGNHEIKGKGYPLYKKIFGPSYYSFEIGNTCFFILDDAQRKINLQQKEWLKKELKLKHILVKFV